MTRREWIAASAAASMAACGAREKKRPPNIVLIMADDLGYHHLGCYGQEKIRTPHLDRMAQEGLLFTDAYAGCTVCAPSRSALMTGLHTGHTPVRGNEGGLPLPAASVTMAEVLRDAGYATGIFGKWGLGEMGTEGIPTRQGFDEALGPLHQVHAQYYYPEYLWKNEAPLALAGNRNGGQNQYAPDVMVDGAVDFLRRHKDRPFFLYHPSIIPHHEYQAPAEAMAEYTGKFREEPFVREDRGFAAQPQPVAAFAAMVTRLDAHVGRILAEVDSLGLARDTLVIFTSDNGAAGSFQPLVDAFDGSAPLRGFKTDLYEGGIRVPMIARWPGSVAAGRSSHACAFWDYLPTFAALAGASAPASAADGLSFVHALVGRPQTEHDFLYWETTRRGKLVQAVRAGNWKAVRLEPGRPLELYDLAADIAESKDLAGSNPEVVQRIETYLATCREDPPQLVEPGWRKPDLGA
ncbi:MAG: arylsulfatase [Bryobacteraceae bacterium]